jgi:S-DNA-T family DNA segregation ATPase FtsK/SpoIIIE
MLIRAAGTRTSRIHGAFLTDDELRAVAAHWRAQSEPMFVLDVSQPAHAQSEDDRPLLYDRALEIIASTDNASTSFLQRQMRIGYNEAARLMDELERRGVVSPPDYVGRRSVYRERNRRPPKPTEQENRPRFRWPWSR